MGKWGNRKWGNQEGPGRGGGCGARDNGPMALAAHAGVIRGTERGGPPDSGDQRAFAHGGVDRIEIVGGGRVCGGLGEPLL